MSVTHKYQYGSNPRHIVELTENQARACNEARVHHLVDTNNGIYVNLVLPDGVTLEDYNSAADILNQFIDDHGGSVEYDEEYAETNPVLIAL